MRSSWGNDVVKFVKSFTIIFFIAMICYTLGANAYIVANPTQLKAQGPRGRWA